MTNIMVVLCVLSNLTIWSYKLLITKKTSDFRIPVKDVILLTGISAIIQAVLIYLKWTNVYIGLYIPYLFIQGYTDFKTGYVYRIPSIVFGSIAILQLIMMQEFNLVNILFSLVFLIFFIICTVLKKIGLGDTISLVVISLIGCLAFQSKFVGAWILNMLLVSLSFSSYTIIAKKKSAPFLPWLSATTIIVLLLYSI